MDSGKIRDKWASGSCAASAEAVEMLSPLETGTIWGRPRGRGRSRETGPSRGYLAPAAARGAGKARQLTELARRGRERPLHLIHGGAFSYTARRERLAPGPARRPPAGMPAAMTQVTAESTGEVPARPRGNRKQRAPERPRPTPRRRRASAAGILARSDPGPGPGLGSGVLVVSGKRWRADPHLPASAARGLLTCWLCTNMWMSCAQRHRACAYGREYWGFRCTGGPRTRSLPGKSPPAPAHPEETGIVHMPRLNR